MQDVEPSSSPLALLELIAGRWTTPALHVAARLGIADRALVTRKEGAERVLRDRTAASSEHRLFAASDLNMMVVLSGRGRDETAFRALSRAGGFTVTRIAPAGLSFWVIEGTCA